MYKNTYNYSTYTSEAKMKAFIAECEYRFEREIREAVLKIIEREGHETILLCGPTCSGKTTVSSMLINVLKETGRKTAVVSIDNFFKNKNAYIERESIKQGSADHDYEGVSSLRMDDLQEAVTSILNKQLTEIPIYNFVTGGCTGYDILDARNADVVIFEGIQTVYPEITEMFGDSPKLSVFINLWDEIEINGITFNQREIRLMRRMVRDNRDRGSDAEFTMHIWENVVKNEDSRIFPNIPEKSIKIPTSLPYEVGMLKKSYCELCSLLDSDIERNKFALDVMAKLNEISNINEKFAPRKSLIREFIGKR